MSEEKIFLLEGFDGRAGDAYFFRSDLFKHIDRLEKANLKPVAIIVKKGSWNIEIALEGEGREEK